MQCSYHLRSTILATTSKFKMAVEIGVFRLIREALYFGSKITATTSKFCWELQIDVSIIYSFIRDRSQTARALFCLFFEVRTYPPRKYAHLIKSTYVPLCARILLTAVSNIQILPLSYTYPFL